MYIDVDKLRKELLDETAGAYFSGGFGGAIIEHFDIENATDEEIIEIAQAKGKYIVNDVFCGKELR